MNTFSISDIQSIRKIEEGDYGVFMKHASVYEGLSGASRLNPNRKALTYISSPDPVDDSQSWSYLDLLDEVRRTANLFSSLTAGQTPRVAMLLPAIPQAYFTLFGGETAGVVCPINYMLDEEHIADLVRATQANLLVALGPNVELDIWSRVAGLKQKCPNLRHLLAVGGAPHALDFDAELKKMPASSLQFSRLVDSNSVAALFHTGGTTGKPKLAQHTHGNQLHAAWGAAQMYGAAPEDVVINGFPLFHVAGSFVYGLSTLLSGGEVILPTLIGMRNKTFIDHYWEFVEKHKVTLLATVPTVMATLLRTSPGNADLSSVRALLTGGSPLPDELANIFERQFGIDVRNILGMTECAGVIAIEPVNGPRIKGSCGLALPFTRVYAVSEEGVELPAGTTGILCVCGPNVGPGYTEAERNKGTFTSDGQLITGDIGYVDDTGRVFITGRAKDLIIRSSHNIDPQVIENALLSHPEVVMAAAVGAPDEYAGEIPVAFVTLKPGSNVTPEQLLAFANQKIPERPACPKRIDILQTIPLTAIGKIYKPALKVEAARRVLSERLEGASLAKHLQFSVIEESSQMTIIFDLAKTANQHGITASIQQLMSGFALKYRVNT